MHGVHDRRSRKRQKSLLVSKLFFSVMFAGIFIVLTKTKVSPILGTDSKISLSTMFGPILSSVLGFQFGLGTVLLSQAFGTAIGLYNMESFIDTLVFVPILASSVYFARSLKGDRRMMVLPLLCMLAFNLNPIGRQVWYYSLFWTIPMLTVGFSQQIRRLVKRNEIAIYLYSLGTTFVDHGVGSVMYLWAFNIPAEMWIAAIPLTIAERLIIAAGIDFMYHAVKYSMRKMQEPFLMNAMMVSQAHAQKRKVKASQEHIR